MVTDIGGPVWGWAVVILTVVLGAALAYGLVMWSRRSTSPEMREVRDQGTKRVYREAEQEARETRGE